MPISDVASLLGGAALGAPFSVIFNLLMEEVMKVKDFKPISRDLLSIMQRLVPIINKIESMSLGSGPSEGELNFLFETMKRAEDMVSKCSRVKWYSIGEKTWYTRKIKEINRDFLRFFDHVLPLIQYKNLSSLSTKIDILTDTLKGSAELFVVPQPETVTIFWLLRPLRELKKMLLEDHVVTVVVSAPSACGKTMLVSKLCHDADVRGKFKQIFFITVSKAPNVSLIVQRFLQHTGREANDFADNLDARLCIQQLLPQLGESGPILLVLDDVWPEDESLLDTFLIQLPDYKILVTSRSEFLRFGPTYSLEPLIDEDVKNLFMDCTPHPNCLTCAKRNDILLKLKSLIGLVHAGKFGHVQFRFMNLMNLYATAGDFDSVLKTWDEYIFSGEEKGCCTESYNIVMQVYVSLGKDADAVQTFDQMINNGGIPNSRTFTIMIEHLVKSGNLDAAMEVFETLPSMRITRTLKHYSVLVEAFVDAQRFDRVKTLLAEMKADGKFPSRRMFEPLQRMREAGFEQETGEFLREMLPDERIKDVSMYSMCNPSDSEEEKEEEEPQRDAQVKLKPWLDPKALANSLKKWNPDTVAALEEANFVWTNVLVCKMLRNFRSPETAWSFFCWVAVQPGFTHDAYTIERMMAMLARNGQVELVDKLISKVRMEGIKLPFSTIRLIIDLYGVSKKPEAAIKVFRHDRTTLCGSVSGFNLMLLYSSLLRTLTKCKRNAEALETLEEMVSTGVSLDIQTFSGLMYHFALQGEIQTVQRLFSMVRQIGLEPDPYMLKLLVQAYCRCERSVLAFRVFQDMKDLNLIPDRETKELLVRSLWREEKRKEAAAVEESSYCDEEGDSSSVLRLTLKGHVWNFSSRDIARVYNLYRDCILKTPS
ncbi:unnamed protein product [Brassica oleracea var. botrytis]